MVLRRSPGDGAFMKGARFTFFRTRRGPVTVRKGKPNPSRRKLAPWDIEAITKATGGHVLLDAKKRAHYLSKLGDDELRAEYHKACDSLTPAGYSSMVFMAMHVRGMRVG